MAVVFILLKGVTCGIIWMFANAIRDNYLATKVAKCVSDSAKDPKPKS